MVRIIVDSPAFSGGTESFVRCPEGQARPDEEPCYSVEGGCSFDPHHPKPRQQLLRSESRT